MWSLESLKFIFCACFDPSRKFPFLWIQLFVMLHSGTTQENGCWSSLQPMSFSRNSNETIGATARARRRGDDDAFKHKHILDTRLPSTNTGSGNRAKPHLCVMSRFLSRCSGRVSRSIKLDQCSRFVIGWKVYTNMLVPSCSRPVGSALVSALVVLFPFSLPDLLFECVLKRLSAFREFSILSVCKHTFVISVSAMISADIEF